MFSNNFVTIFTFFAFCVGLQILFTLSLLRYLIIMHCNWLNIYFFLPFQNKCLDIYEPPIASFIFDKIAYKLFESDF